MGTYFSWIQRITENRLTRHKAIKAANAAAKAKKRTFKGELLGWLDAIVFAVVLVLIVNQYLFQLFMIPSPSMVSTLEIKDRVFVSKTTYGIELYPGGKKVFATTIPLRDEVIVFYNPLYISKGPVFDILSQLIYMASFSLINIDVDEKGNMKERLYVKRVGATGGETVFFTEGKVSFLNSGQSSPLQEADLRSARQLSGAPHQSIDPSMYPAIKAYGSLLAYQEADLSAAAPSFLVQQYRPLAEYTALMDYYEVQKAQSKTSHQINPADIGARLQAGRYERGIYVPTGYVLPLGDNRDNSQDGRYFGPVPFKKIIGSVKFRFWPLKRLGIVR